MLVHVQTFIYDVYSVSSTHEFMKRLRSLEELLPLHTKIHGEQEIEVERLGYEKI